MTMLNSILRGLKQATTSGSKERESSAEREEVKGDAIAEALAPTLEDFTNDLGQWGEINANTREYWAKKGPKDCQRIESKFEESARRYPG